MWCRFGWGGAGAGGPPPPLSPTQMGALCSHEGRTEGDTLPTSKEQEANNITTPSARSLKQGKIDEMFKPEGRPPQQAESSTLPNNKEEDKEFGEQQEEGGGDEQHPGEEEETPRKRKDKIRTGQIPTVSNTAQKTNINTETSSEQPCSFKKGTCIKHNTPGTKYVVTKTKWKDRGMGKGFGNVYSRTVKYHCSGEGKTGPDTF